MFLSIFASCVVSIFVGLVILIIPVLVYHLSSLVRANDLGGTGFFLAPHLFIFPIWPP